MEKAEALGKLFVTVPEAAAVLGIGRSKLYEIAQEGGITFVHIGRAVRVPIRAVKEYAERIEAEAAAGR